MWFFKVVKLVIFFFILFIGSLEARIWMSDEAGVGNIGVVNLEGVSTKNPAFVLNNKFEIGVGFNYFNAGVDFGNINNMNFVGGYRINKIHNVGIIINYIGMDTLGDNVRNFSGKFMYNYGINNFIFGVSADIQYETYSIDNNISSIFNAGAGLGVLYKGVKNFKFGVAVYDINSKNYDYLIDRLGIGGIYNISNLSILGEVGSFKEKITGKLGVVLRYLNNRFKVRSGINIGGSDIFRVDGMGAGFSYRIYNFDIIYSGYYIFNLGSYGIHSIGIKYLIAD